MLTAPQSSDLSGASTGSSPGSSAKRHPTLPDMTGGPFMMPPMPGWQQADNAPLRFQLLRAIAEHHGFISYNQFSRLLHEHQTLAQAGVDPLITEVRIQPVKQAPALFQAVVTVPSYGVLRVWLPDSATAGLRSALTGLRIPFFYRPEPLSVSQLLTGSLIQTFQVIAGPLILTALASLPVLALNHWIHTMRQDQRLMQWLKPFVCRDYTLKREADDVLAEHMSVVQSRINRFLRHEWNLLILEGPDGAGKTHLLEAIATKLQDAGDTLIFNPSFGERKELFKILTALYHIGPIHPEGKRILKILERFHPNLKAVMIVMDNLQELPAGFHELMPFITGQRSAHPQLPKLRLVGAWGRLSTVTADAFSGIQPQRIFLEPRSQAYQVRRMAERLQHTFPDLNRNELLLGLEQLNAHYPGYNMRNRLTLVEHAALEAGENISAHTTPPVNDILQALRRRLAATPLNAAELFSLIDQCVLNRLQQVLPEVPESITGQLRAFLFQNPSNYPARLNQLAMNGGEWQAYIQQSLDDVPPEAFSTRPDAMADLRNQLLNQLTTQPLHPEVTPSLPAAASA